jgi:flagellar basal body-associated protein FliL
MDTEQTPRSSRRLLFVGLGAVIALIILIAVVAFALAGGTKQESNTPPASSDNVTSTETAKQNLTDVESSIKQAQTDQAAAKAALKEGDKQIKVGS